MKKLMVFIVLLFFSTTAFAQSPSYKDKLYYTCKVCGFVKYFHSRVSVCRVNWDSVLISSLPVIKNAVSETEFNDALLTMLQAAGPMTIVTTPSPDTLATELKRNFQTEWYNDPIFRSNVKEILDTIKNNFRPHANCWVKNNDGTGYGWLVFPRDDPIINTDISVSYPDEFTRLKMIFKHWNIINYFNPYNYVLDIPWDSTLFNNVLTFTEVSDYRAFLAAFERITATLDDAHVEGLTRSLKYPLFGEYVPRLLLRYTQNQYVVVKSGYTEITAGDIILTINGLTTTQWEDSLRPYISV